MYVTQWRIRATIVALEKQEILHILSLCCNLRYPAFNAHEPPCHLLPVRLYNIFPHYLIHDTIFGKTLLNIKCVCLFSLQLLYEKILILRRNERDRLKMYIGFHVNYPLFFSDFNGTWNFLDKCSKNSQTSNFIKIRPVVTELFHAEGRTDM